MKQTNRSLITAGILSWAAKDGLFSKPQGRKPKEEKCLLEGCNNLTSRGWCCAEHCKEHKHLRRAKRIGRGK